MVDLVEKLLGNEAEIELQPMQPGDVLESFADIEYSFDRVGFLPEISIFEGIPRIITWYL